MKETKFDLNPPIKLPKMKVEELVEKIIADFLNRERRPREVGKYYPSELFHCIRKNYYAYTKPKKFGLDTLKRFEGGILIHNWFRNVLFKGYSSDLITEFDYEESLVHKEDGIEVRGRYDDLVAVDWEKQPILLEVKTTSSLKWVKKPSRHHIGQMNFYLSKLKLKEGHIIYLDKRNLKHKIFKVKQSDELFMEIIKRARLLHKHLTKKKTPFPEAKTNPEMRWFCNYCLYRLECLKDGGA